MSSFLVKQLPVLPPSAYLQTPGWLSDGDLRTWIVDRAMELIYTNYEMCQLAEEVGDHAAPFRWNEYRRGIIRAELDAAFFHLYDIDRTDVEYVMDSFDTLRRREEKECGEFRTKRMILAVYDAMSEAIRAGTNYLTPLAPPPRQGPRHPDH